MGIHMSKSKRAVASEFPDICQRFKEIRISNRLTQKEMAEIVGLSSPAIGAIENGRYTPNFNVMRALKKKLNIKYDYLIDGDVSKNNSDVDNSSSQLSAEIDRLSAENARLLKMIDRLL